MNVLKFFVLLMVPFAFVGAEDLAPEPHFTRIARETARTMPKLHMNHEPLSDSMNRRVMENFLKALDFDRSFFLAADVKQLRTHVDKIDDDLQSGNLDFAYQAFSLFKERAQNRVEFVLAQLDEGFDFEKNEYYLWKRKDASWVESEAEWDELWRQKIKNELVGSLVSREMRKLEAEEKAAEEAAAASNTVSNVVTVVVEDASTNAVADVAQVVDSNVVDVAEGTNVVADVEEKEPPTPEEVIRKRYEQFLTVLNGHDPEYVLQMYLNAFTRAYDTHSAYFSPRAEEDFDISMRLSLKGIGALLQYDEGAAKIQELIKGGPAERDGRLQPGDKIIAVAQGDEEAVDIMFWPLYKSVRLIRGEIGTTVVLSVIPASDPTGSSVKKIDLVRDEIKLEDKAAKSLVHEQSRGETDYKLGIIHLPDFYADLSSKRSNPEEARSCAKDVRRLLGELNEAEVDGLVLDLRNNGGGSLTDCVEMSGFFVDSGPMVQVKQTGQNARAMYDPHRGIEFDKPMVVLVNRQSASASEILAAALQDYGRAIVVGDSKTHGKGSVQSVVPLDRGNPKMGALKATTAKFYRVDGRSTQLKGVAPDIVIRTPTDVLEMGEEYMDNVLPWSWVPPASYRPYDALSTRIQALKTLSEARLQDNDRFAAYQAKIDRLEERVQRRKVSLHLEERIAQAMADRELDRLHEQGMTGGDGIPGEGDEEEPEVEEIQPENDMVLQEGLEILLDLITDAQPEPAAAEAASLSPVN